MFECPDCEGKQYSGLLFGGELEDCSTCKGDGLVSHNDAELFYKKHPEKKNTVSFT
ncbi:MAG: hypothetical protein Q8P20_06330 [bacterium]|nr:hypothetical protein [bacterium]